MRILKTLFIFSFSVALFLHCVKGGLVTIKGQIYFEAPLTPGHAWVNDTWYDYTNQLGSNLGRVTVFSGDVEVRPNGEGEFSISGSLTVGEVLLKVEAENYQTAYVYVDYKDIEDSEYEQKIAPGKLIQSKLNPDESLSFYIFSSGCNAYGPPCSSIPTKTDELTLNPDAPVTILLLQNTSGSDFNKFSYVP